MSGERFESVEQNTSYPSPRAQKKDVDLFPPLADRQPDPIASVAAGGGTPKGPQISMFQPTSYEEALDIVSCLRARASTTISLEKMRKLDAGRLVDFVSGASAAIDGNFHKLTDYVYLFCPANMRIVAPSKEVSPAKLGASPLDFLFSNSGLENGGLRTKN